MGKKYKTALVIGKFYPPHNGHIFLIEQAAQIADKVVVIVYGTQYQHISLVDREAWLKDHFKSAGAIGIHPLLNDIYDDYEDDNVWEAHDHVLKAKLRSVGIKPEDINVVVSSEDYGERLSEYFPAADSFVVDLAREMYNISGTKCRNDLFGNWKSLPTETRVGLIPRVVIVGAESTGTTTLALDLAEHYRARYVPEYGREYTVEWLKALREADPNATMADLVWTREDFKRIGEHQTVLENRAAAKLEGFPLVIADTDALATGVWEYRYLRNPKKFVYNGTETLLDKPTYTGTPKRDLYLLTDWYGVEFEDDGYRDGEHLREKMTVAFEDVLTGKGVSWALLRGTHEERMAIAIKMIDKILKERTEFD